MRARYLFATLKNRLTPQETVDLTLAVRDQVRPDRGGVAGVCPSAAALAWMRDCRGGLALGAQNCGWTASYSLTGELSVRDLETLAVSHCIIGHSERRTHLGETEDIIRLRLSALLSAAIAPILCVGETLAQRREQATADVLRVQLGTLLGAFKAALIEPNPAKFIIAYEPMWAVSTSGPHLPVEPDQAAAAHRTVRERLDELFGAHFGEATSVIFGGGVDSANAEGFFEQPEVDGGLVGSGMQTAPGFKGVLDGFYRARR
jgi:triosephosphate isomerase